MSEAYQVPPSEVRVGPYRVVAELARGGMAAVFLAVRADGSLGPMVQVPPRALRTADDGGPPAPGDSDEEDEGDGDGDDHGDTDDERHNCQGCGGGHLPNEILLCDHCDGARARDSDGCGGGGVSVPRAARGVR